MLTKHQDMKVVLTFVCPFVRLFPILNNRGENYKIYYFISYKVIDVVIFSPVINLSDRPL